MVRRRIADLLRRVKNREHEREAEEALRSAIETGDRFRYMAREIEEQQREQEDRTTIQYGGIDIPQDTHMPLRDVDIRLPWRTTRYDEDLTIDTERVRDIYPREMRGVVQRAEETGVVDQERESGVERLTINIAPWLKNVLQIRWGDQNYTVVFPTQGDGEVSHDLPGTVEWFIEGEEEE